jgi:hypothetical protein
VGRPDALFLPTTLKRGSTIVERVVSVSAVAEPLLEVDYAAGERAFIRSMPHGRLFVTRDPADTIYFPTGHPQSGEHRYRWEKRGDGVEIGYLVEGANDRRKDEA